MRHVALRVLIVASVLASAGNVRGEGPTPEIPSNLVLERFAVSKNGDALLVPVRVADTDYLFLVDTGATGTVFDTSFPLGQPVDIVTVQGSEGKVDAKLYHPPEAKIGRTSLGPLDAVVGVDLNGFRRVSGQPIQGIPGMDFPGRYVFHIDREKGELLLLKTAPKDAGMELPISWEPGELPFVAADIAPGERIRFMAPGERIRFMIDTGDIGLDTSSLGIFETGSLVKKGQFREIGKTLHESISGTNSRQLFRGGALSIGGSAVHSPIFSESYGPHPNRLGLGFWSRFAATFDFPERKAYLRKSAHFGRPDRWNPTGLHLWKRGDSIEVFAVDPDSPAARAGLKKGDVLVELNGLNADKTGLFDVRYTLCDGGPWTCVVRRDSQERRLSIGQTR